MKVMCTEIEFCTGSAERRRNMKTLSAYSSGMKGRTCCARSGRQTSSIERCTSNNPLDLFLSISVEREISLFLILFFRSLKLRMNQVLRGILTTSLFSIVLSCSISHRSNGHVTNRISPFLDCREGIPLSTTCRWSCPGWRISGPISSPAPSEAFSRLKQFGVQ